MTKNKTLSSLLLGLILLSLGPFAYSEKQVTPIDDTVEEDIFFDDLPDGGIDFIDELPTEESPDRIYDRPGGQKKPRKRQVDVRDRGPIELKQGPDSSPEKNVTTPDLIKEDPLFSFEKEQPIEKPAAQKPTQATGGDDPFQFPDAVEKGAPTGPEAPSGPRVSKPSVPTPPVLLPEEEADIFGQPSEGPARTNDKKQVAKPAPKPGPPVSPEEDEAPNYAEDEPSIGIPETDSRKSLVYNPNESPRRSSSPSVTPYDDIEVIYQQRHAKEVKIKHPYAEKGLVRITQDRTYVYRVPKSEQKNAVGFRFGVFNPENLENSETGATFADLYETTDAPIIFLEYEWQWFQTAVGKFGLKIGSGLFVAEGSGNFKNNYAENGSKNKPLEKFTFVAFPNSVGAVYRAQFYDRQPLVPYVDGGLMGITFAEFRDDKDLPKLGLGTAAFFSAGGALNLGLLDSLSLLELDREYGINSIFLTGEFRQVVQLGGRFNFESSTVTGGVLMEF